MAGSREGGVSGEHSETSTVSERVYSQGPAREVRWTSLVGRERKMG